MNNIQFKVTLFELSCRFEKGQDLKMEHHEQKKAPQATLQFLLNLPIQIHWS
jgi:hypothetical protein